MLGGTGVSFQVDGDERAGVPGPAGRLPRPSRARARPHAQRRRRRARRARLRPAALRRRTRCCRAPASRGSARPGCCRARRRIIRGRERLPSDAPTWAELRERPAHVVERRRRRAGRASTARPSAERPRSRPRRRIERTGLPHYVVPPGKLMNPPHVHSAEEEIFVVLEGSGTLQLYPSPRRGRSRSRRSRSGRAASIARPAGTRRRPRDPGRRRRADAARVRHARSERHRLLPALGEDQLSRRRRDRPARAGSTTGMARIEGERGTAVNEAPWDSSDFCRARPRALETQPPRPSSRPRSRRARGRARARGRRERVDAGARRDCPRSTTSPSSRAAGRRRRRLGTRRDSAGAGARRDRHARDRASRTRRAASRRRRRR